MIGIEFLFLGSHERLLYPLNQVSHAASAVGIIVMNGAACLGTRNMRRISATNVSHDVPLF